MPNDFVYVDPGTGAGKQPIKCFNDGTNEWPAGIVAYVTGGSAGAWTLQYVDATHGLPINVLNASIAVTGTFWQATQPVSGTISAVTAATISGALPTGANTIGAVNQGTSPWVVGLNSIGGTGISLGQAVAGSSVPVVLTAAQVTTLTPPAAITGFATESTLSTASGSLLTIAGKDFATQTTLAAASAKLPATLGQKTMANAMAVVIASDQTPVSITGALSGALPTGANTIGAVTQGTSPWVIGLNSVSGTALTFGQGTMAASLPVVIASNQTAVSITGALSGAIPTGTNTIGAVTQGTSPWSTNMTSIGGVAVSAGNGISGTGVLRVTLASDGTGVVGLNAGTNLVGVTISPHQTGALYSGTTALTPKFATISTASSGNTTVVAAVTSKKIRVLSYRFQADADVGVKFRDNTAPADLTGVMATGAKGGGGGAAYSPVGHFETASGNALSINLSSAVQVSGHLVYVEV